MPVTPPAELTVLTATLPSLLAAIPARPAAGGPDDSAAPRIDFVIDRDDHDGVTHARVYLNGTLVEARSAAHWSDNDVHPVVRFHLTDSGPCDDTQHHQWYAEALGGVATAPDDVRAFVAERARQYHPSDDCLDCLTQPVAAALPPGHTLPASRNLDDLTTNDLEDVHHAAAHIIRARLTAVVRRELRAAVAGIQIDGKPLTKAVLPVQASYVGTLGAYDLTEAALYGGTGRWVETDLSDATALVRAVEALANWRPAADGDPLQINL
ncbi:hypothetical protein [Kitasatospora aburaviensis]|uniref:Uncharacterized protein n=1 Tax=Kitasatospora aburaviensis TaxID=67265 RepID=A0ABW1EXC9_9ACTN